MRLLLTSGGVHGEILILDFCTIRKQRGAWLWIHSSSLRNLILALQSTFGELLTLFEAPGLVTIIETPNLTASSLLCTIIAIVIYAWLLRIDNCTIRNSRQLTASLK